MTHAVSFRLALFAAVALAGCDAKDAPNPTIAKADAAAKAGDANAAPAEKEAAQKPVDPIDPIKTMVDKRVSAKSGVGVGGKFSAFDIVNAETGKTYCQVCQYGPSPKIMAIGTVDDEAFKKDIKDLDAIVKKYGEDKIKAFAVITEIEGGKAKTSVPVADAQARAKALQAELGVAIPIVVPAPDKDGPNRVWDEYYNVTASRTVMFADGSNTVRWNGVAADDFKELNDAITEVLKG